MTREEVLNLAFPKSVGGMVRPEEPIPTDWDFSTELPQFLRNDLNLGDQENAFLRQLLSNDKIMNVLIDGIKNQLADCDLRLVTQALKGLMSPVDKTKLDGIQAGATNYTHPANHPASIITQDASRRMVSDTQINSWTAKANANHGNHIPTLETADNARFLRNDGTFQTVTPAGIGAAPIASPGFTGTPTAPTVVAETNNTQIATTAFVKAIATAANCGGIVGCSLAQNGWVKFANGLILQWGSRNSDADGVARLTFPVTFTSFYTIIGIHTGGDIAIVSELALYHYLNSACLWVKQANGAVNTFGLNWIAIGR